MWTCCGRLAPSPSAASASSPAALTRNERTGTRTQSLCAVRISFLDIPEENTLHYLSGKVIKLKDPQIVKQFDGLDKNKQAPAEEK